MILILSIAVETFDSVTMTQKPYMMYVILASRIWTHFYIKFTHRKNKGKALELRILREIGSISTSTVCILPLVRVNITPTLNDSYDTSCNYSCGDSIDTYC